MGAYMQGPDYCLQAAGGQEKPWHQGFDCDAFMIRAELYKWLMQVGLLRATQVVGEIVDLEEGRCDGNC
jgi:hypothetical protein